MKNIAVLSGGFTDEKIISMRSAAMVMDHIDTRRFNATQILIDHSGWFALEEGQQIAMDKNDFSYSFQGEKRCFDLVFMMIHGTPGEDGKLQGYFDLIGLPYTTGGVLSMALTASKGTTTDHLKQHGFHCATSQVIRKGDPVLVEQIVARVGLPCFVKPNNGGSSIATFKITKIEALEKAIHAALAVDKEAIIETFVSGTEVTCGVIQKDGAPLALPITEIVAKNDFFDFDAKYKGQSEEITPARIDERAYKKIQEQAVAIYKLLNFKGMIRIDFFAKEDQVTIIEVNAVPGFSPQSILPQQAAHVGIDKRSLISMVIDSII